MMMFIRLDKDDLITYEEVEKNLLLVFEDTRRRLLDGFLEEKKDDSKDSNFFLRRFELIYYKRIIKHLDILLKDQEKTLAKKAVDTFREDGITSSFSDTYMMKAIAADYVIILNGQYSKLLIEVLETIRPLSI